MEVLGLVLITAGVLFLSVGSIGVIRLPDFYCRLHAATKPDTLGLILCMLGLAAIQGFTVTSAKMMLIVLFVSIANPAANHALARAALRSGLRPWTKEEEKPS